MEASTVIFYIISALILGGALLSVTAKKIFRAAIFLLFSLIGIAGLYFFLEYEFIAAVQIVVYVGGIVVLIIFSIFLTQASGENMKESSMLSHVFAVFATCFAAVLTWFIIKEENFAANSEVALVPSAKNIGTQMLSVTGHGYILPFEAVSILLLAAMVGCIVIAIKLKPKEGSKEV